jgi:azurin
MTRQTTSHIDARQAVGVFLGQAIISGEFDGHQGREPVYVLISHYDMTTKTHLTLGGSLLSILILVGCGKSDNTAAQSPGSSAPKAEAPAKPTSGRAVLITASDTMKYNITEIRAKPGEALSVTLTNEGTVPKFSMGHNWVLLKVGTDLNAFATEAMNAAVTEYIPASYKDSVLAATKLLGPKESDTILFYAPTQPGHYPFLCAFPGHMQVGMKGELIVE